MKYLIILFLCLIGNVFCSQREWAIARRQKRFLIYQNGGILKLVCGVIIPFNLGDKKLWRQMNLAVNLQAQYAVPTTPLYPWNKWEGRLLTQMKSFYEIDVEDGSRKILYSYLEMYMNAINGRNGRRCLQRMICENAGIMEVDGLLAELFHFILTPKGENIDEMYTEAYNAGKSGASCDTLYTECPRGEGLFDKFVRTIHSTDDID